METDKKDKIIADLSLRIIILVFTIIVLLIAVLFLCLQKPAPIKKELGICGNVSQEDEQHQKGLLKYGEDQNSDKGERLFRMNCAACHSISHMVITAPGLEGILNRVPSENWLINYISNSDSLFKLGDPYTLKLRAEFPEERMPNFDTLSKKEIIEIVSYLKVPLTRAVN